MVEACAGREADADAPLIVPVPLSDARLRERGYNQAWELARRLAPRLGGRAEPSLLLRLRDTPHQIALPPAERAGNVRGAFAVEPRRRGEIARPARGAGRRRDDHRQHRRRDRAGAASTPARRAVEVWVVARTPRPADR